MVDSIKWILYTFLAMVIMTGAWLVVTGVTCWATGENYPMFKVKREGFACTIEGEDRDKFLINYYRQEFMMRCSMYGECDAKDRAAYGERYRERETIQEW